MTCTTRLLSAAAVAVLAAASVLYAQRSGAGHPTGEQVREVARYPIGIETLDRDSVVTIVDVAIAPGEQGVPHHHPGPAYVFVAEGEYELGLDDQPTRRFKAGESFTEPANCLHRVSRNPAAVGTTRLVAFIVHPRAAKDVAVPEAAKAPVAGHEAHSR